jgi:hypothetical protein
MADRWNTLITITLVPIYSYHYDGPYCHFALIRIFRGKSTLFYYHSHRLRLTEKQRLLICSHIHTAVRQVDDTDARNWQIVYLFRPRRSVLFYRCITYITLASTATGCQPIRYPTWIIIF